MYHKILYLLKKYSYFQLILIAVALFLGPLIPQPAQRFVMAITFYILVVVCAFLVNKHSVIYVNVAYTLVGLRLVADILGIPSFSSIEESLLVMFFMWLSVVLVRQTVHSKIDDDTITTAIIGYLLLAISLSLLMTVIIREDPTAFTYLGQPIPGELRNFSFSNYFVFVTYTTLGYGDVLPVTPLAQTFAKLTSIAGQIYLTINVAILVGKYINHSNKKEDDNGTEA